MRGDLVRHQADVLLDLGVLELAADQALDGVEGVLGVGDRLALGRRTHEDLAILGIGHDRGRGAITFRVLDDLGLAAFHDRNARIGRAQVDADNLAHGVTPSRYS